LRFQGINLRLETARLELRPPEVEDAAEVFTSYASDPAVTKYMLFAPHTDVSEADTFINLKQAQLAAGEAMTWMIRLRGEPGLIGALELRVIEQRGDVGFALAKAYWGRGIVAEALSAVLEFGRTKLGLRHVTGMCDTENLQSARVFEKCGFRNLGVKPRANVHPAFGAEPRDALCFDRELE
jgi:RimJ/RimL family protein N-acetyltransferase